ncbi:reverse transcriptase domain-containing protein [Tanacetum coccineum]
MSRQGRHCLKSSIPKMLERRTKVKRKARKPEQTTEAEEAFKQMKQLIAELPMLTAPIEKEELIVYLAAAKETGIKRSKNKLHINGKTSASLGTCQPRISVKGQILTDFIVERPDEESSDTLMEVEEELPELWILFTNGSSYTNGFGAGLILTNPEGMEFTYALRFRFDATNNEAEYEALISGVRIAEQIGVKNLQTNVDSRLVANQVNETYVTKEVDMIRYLEKVRTLASSFKAFSIRQVPRSENKKANALSKIASISFAHLSKQVLVEEIKEKSIGEVEILAVVEEEGDTWMTLIFEYITEETLPADVKKARADPFKQTMSSERYMKDLVACMRAHDQSWPKPTEAVITEEIDMPTLRTAEVDLVQNIEALEINLDLLEEKREQAAIREAKSKAKMEKYYNSKVRSTSFKPGDLVYHKNNASHAEDTGKLGPKWKGPYEVTKALGKGAYKLRDRDGKQLPRTWNVSNLKKCYIHKM